MIWRIPGISLNLHYPKEDDGELYTACPIIKGSRGIEPLNPLPQRRIRLTLPAYLCLKTALRRSEIREYYNSRLPNLCRLAGFQLLNLPLHYPLARLPEASVLCYGTQIFTRNLTGSLLFFVIHA